MKKPLPRVSRRIIAADLFSDIGNQFIALFLVDLLVFKGNNAISSLVVLCLIHQLPSIFLSPLAGQGVDRFGPGRWMMLVTLCKCLLVCAFALVSARWEMLTVYLLFVSASLFFTIGRLSAVPLFIAGEGILGFNAVNERVAIGGAVLSPWLIGMFLAQTPQTGALIMAALIFAGTALLLASLPDPRRSTLAVDGQKRATGMDVFPVDAAPSAQGGTLYACFIMLGLVILGGGTLNLGLPLLFKTLLNGDIARWGLMMSAFQAGAFLSTLMLPRCSELLQRKNMPATGLLVLAATMFVLPFAAGIAQLAGLMVLLGFGFTLMHLFWESRIQQNSPVTAIGRAMSFLAAFKGACYLGAILCGAVISSFWSAESFLMIGAVVLGSASFVVRRI